MATTDLADTNVLLALHAPGHPFHLAAARWFDACEAFATTPITEGGMVRLLMRTDVMCGRPVPPSQALAMLTRLKQQPNSAFWPDSEGLDHTRFAYAIQGPAQVTDLHLLDLAVAHSGRLVTFDTKVTAALKPSHRKHVRLLEP